MRLHDIVNELALLNNMQPQPPVLICAVVLRSSQHVQHLTSNKNIVMSKVRFLHVKTAQPDAYEEEKGLQGHGAIQHAILGGNFSTFNVFTWIHKSMQAMKSIVAA